MLKLSYETDMPAGDQIYCYFSCNVRRNKGEIKKIKTLTHLFNDKDPVVELLPLQYGVKV